MGLDDIQALVFDMGGVLYDTPREITLMTRFIFKGLGLTQFLNYTDSQIEHVTKQIDEAFDKNLVKANVDSHWLPSYDDSVEYDRLLLETLGLKEDIDDMASEAHRRWTNAYTRLKPKFMEPCRAVLEALHYAGYSLGVASNRRNDPLPPLQSDGILSLFDVVEYSCVPGYRKPSPYMLLQVASKLGINPRKCAYVGDKVDPDMRAATNAEFLPILLVWCAHEEAAKAPDGILVIENIDELRHLLPMPDKAR